MKASALCTFDPLCIRTHLRARRQARCDPPDEVMERFDVTREKVYAVLEFAARSLDPNPCVGLSGGIVRRCLSHSGLGGPGDVQCLRFLRFLGIVIAIFYSEHGVPHFHAVYGEHEISVEIESGTIHGEFPARALRLVLEWAALHRQELIENWQLARQGQPLRRIAPLE
jgi:Domain of unknown function (DUF4160)